jgi:hypothetical protein
MLKVLVKSLGKIGALPVFASFSLNAIGQMSLYEVGSRCTEIGPVANESNASSPRSRSSWLHAAV